MRPLTYVTSIVTASLLTACAPVDSTPVPLTEKQSATLSKQLVGKVAGKPVNCISDMQATHLIRVSDDILLYRVSSRLVYENRLRYSCPGLARDDDIIVSEQFGSQKCSGDLIRLVDRSSGIQGPACSLGDFVPYRKDKSAG